MFTNTRLRSHSRYSIDKWPCMDVSGKCVKYKLCGDIRYLTVGPRLKSVMIVPFVDGKRKTLIRFRQLEDSLKKGLLNGRRRSCVRNCPRWEVRIWDIKNKQAPKFSHLCHIHGKCDRNLRAHKKIERYLLETNKSIKASENDLRDEDKSVWL